MVENISRTAEKLHVMLVTSNGGDTLRSLEQMLADDGFSVTSLPRIGVTMDQLRGSHSVIYHYEGGQGESDKIRLHAFVTQYAKQYSSAAPVIVVGKELPDFVNAKGVIPVSGVNTAALKQVVRAAAECAGANIRYRTPKGVVLLYDRDGSLHRFNKEKLRGRNLWTERCDNAADFLKRLQFEANMLDAVVLDYADHVEGQMLVEEVRRNNGRIQVIALARRGYIDSCPADFTVLRTDRYPWVQLLNCINRALTRKREQEWASQETGPHGEVGTRYLPGFRKHPHVFIVMAPPAAGKSTICESVAELAQPRIDFIRKYATRQLRPGESDGLSMLQLTPEKFDFLDCDRQLFLHTFSYKGNKYGIPRVNTLQALQDGKHVLMTSGDLTVLEPMQRLLQSYGVVPVMLFADDKALEQRILERGFGSMAERQARLRTLPDDQRMYENNHHLFPYKICTGHVDPPGMAYRLLRILHWEERFDIPRPVDETHDAYVNSVTWALFGTDSKTLLNQPKRAAFEIDRDVLSSHCRHQGLDGVPPAVEKMFPAKVAAAALNYGHLGIFFDGHGDKYRHTYLSRTLLLDTVDYALRQRGYFPAARLYHGRTSLSRLALATTEGAAMIDGLLYSLTDDYVLGGQDAPPRAVSIGFIDPACTPEGATMQMLQDRVMADRRTSPYYEQLRETVMRTLRLI